MLVTNYSKHIVVYEYGYSLYRQTCLMVCLPKVCVHTFLLTFGEWFMPATTSRVKFITGSVGPQMGVNACTCPPHETPPRTAEVRDKVREEQKAIIRGRVDVSESELEAMSAEALARLAASFGWLNSQRSAPIVPRSGPRPMDVVTNNVEPLQRPRALVTRYEKELLAHPQTPTIGLSRPKVLINKSEREAGDQPVSNRLERPRVLVNKRDR